MKAGTLIKKNYRFFNGLKWVRVYPWMVGRYVSKRTTTRFKRSYSRAKALARGTSA